MLHTWGQNLAQHLHVHCLVSGGALAPAGHWVHPRRGFLFPVKALSVVFRAKFLDAMRSAFERHELLLAGSTAALSAPPAQRRLLVELRKKAWVVYAKRPFGGPAQVLEYLGRYTHRAAISNERLVGFDRHPVRFRYKDYAHGGRRKVLALDSLEFLRRFALHVLPRGFNRIRHYGLIANRNKQALLECARAALHASAPERETTPAESIAAFWQRIAGIDIGRCPNCQHGTLRLIASLAPQPHPPP